MRVSTAHPLVSGATAAFTPVPIGSEPADAVFAPMTADGDLNLDALPPGTGHGEIDVADAPQGARTVVARIDPGWAWRLLDGEGWCVRQGKGPPRGNGTRPKLWILEPCRSVTLRAVAVDEGFPDTSHHAVLGWVFIERTGKWKADLACVWTTEPAPGVDGRRWWAIPPTEIGVTAVKALLSRAPDGPELARCVEAARVARDEDGVKIGKLEVDRGVSTGDGPVSCDG